jgi:CubicO group peptidase (beta-lactamase class C family)
MEEGKINLDDKLTKFLPDYKNNYSDQVLIRHLLTYSIVLHFPIPGFTIENATAEEIRKNLLTTDLKFPPGEVAQYTNSPALLLTMVIENITGSTLDVLADEYFLKPLGMKDSTFTPENPTAVPPTEITEWRGLVQGVVHDETSFVLGKERPSGCAGLFSNVADLLTFLEMLLNKGELHGKQYFSLETITQMHTNQLSQPDTFMGLGWELNEPRFMGKHANPQMFGKTGFTGTACVIDIEKGLAFVMLSNRTYPKRTSPDAINEVRRDISDIVFNTSI